MKTPIFDFVKSYKEKNAIRLHMPGHKGKNFLGIEEYDITEIEGADVLYSSSGIIKESEGYAASLFGAGKTLFSCEGSSLSIKAMLYIALLSNDAKSKTILATRNAHKAFINACVLLDFNIEWLYSKNNSSVISCNISADELDEKLCLMSEKPAAFYVTSPDYLGNISDIKAFSVICKKHGVLLICDNAHGAYLNFLPENKHPIFLGADMCSDSAHKTLPVLTGGGYLHISKDAPYLYENAKRAMSLFASTSPSYLILQSLDIANAYLSASYKEKLKDCIEEINILKAELKEKGFNITGDEPLKITISAKSYGYTGTEISKYLYDKNIVCEFSDPDFIVFMFTPETDRNSFLKLKNALFNLEKKEANSATAPILKTSKKVMSPKEAAFSKAELVPIKKAKGRVLAFESISCPPAIPIVVSGEEITEDAIKLFEYYGIEEVLVAEKK